MGDRAHEVATAARGDEAREAVALEVAQQLDHRHVSAVPKAPAERRVGRSIEKCCGGRQVVVHGLAGERRRTPPSSTLTSLSSPA
jgi:hypothetical protein